MAQLIEKKRLVGILRGFDLRKEKLEHDYEMKNLQLEQEMPKRFEQGEWVSGKTLSDIIKTLVGKEDKQ